MSDLRFVVVGHPNEGKSSVVSTLTERRIRITETPGETEFSTPYSLEIDGEALLTFVDTPGFQTAPKTKKWIEAEAGNLSVKEWVDRYQIKHNGRPAYKHDARVLSAIADADCLLYVVDTSKPVGPDDRAEMEILRKSKKPHMAVFNKKKEGCHFDQEWHEAIRTEFGGICHEFNALNADLNERVALIEKLKAVDEEWGGIVDEVVSALKEQRAERAQNVAEIIQGLLEQCLCEKVKARAGDGQAFEKARESLEEKIRKYEKKAHRKIKLIFNHERVGVKQNTCNLLDEDVFSKKVVSIFGLNRKQFIMMNAAVGAVVGAGLDGAFGGITFGVFTASGAIIGTFVGRFGIKPLSRLKFKKLIPLGSDEIKVGISKGSQLPYALIDRAFCCYCVLCNRAHAHGGADVQIGLGEGSTLTVGWPAKDIRFAEGYFSKLRKRQNTEEADQKFCGMLKKHMLSPHSRDEIDAHYRKREKILGQPIHEERVCPDGVGRYRTYEKGSIHYHPKVGAKETHGGIREEWKNQGWEAGWLGYPVADEEELTKKVLSGDGSSSEKVGRISYFEHGAIYWVRDENYFGVRQRPDGSMRNNAQSWSEKE